MAEKGSGTAGTADVVELLSLNEAGSVEIGPELPCLAAVARATSLTHPRRETDVDVVLGKQYGSNGAHGAAYGHRLPWHSPHRLHNYEERRLAALGATQGDIHPCIPSMVWVPVSRDRAAAAATPPTDRPRASTAARRPSPEELPPRTMIAPSANPPAVSAAACLHDIYASRSNSIYPSPSATPPRAASPPPPEPTAPAPASKRPPLVPLVPMPVESRGAIAAAAAAARDYIQLSNVGSGDSGGESCGDGESGGKSGGGGGAGSAEARHEPAWVDDPEEEAAHASASRACKGSAARAVRASAAQMVETRAVVVERQAAEVGSTIR